LAISRAAALEFRRGILYAELPRRVEGNRVRPEILFPLFAPITSLSGIGPKIARLIERAAGPVLADLLWHLPTGLIDRRFSPKVAAAPDGAIATLTIHVDAHEPSPVRQRPYRVRCSDDTGEIELIFFRANRAYLEAALPVGQERVVSGKVEYYRGRPQITHPDHIGSLVELATLKSVEPVYRLTATLSPKVLRRAIGGALERVPELPEWIDPEFLRRQAWPRFREAIQAVHAPQSPTDLEPASPARSRLAFDELYANQLTMALARARYRRARGRALIGDGRLRALVMARLPYRLTRSQTSALADIEADLKSGERMLRVLQGDVGSGKTVVALFGMLIVVEAGTQAALLAPTEVLARQHMKTIAPLAEAAGVKLALLTGRDKPAERKQALQGLASGEIAIAVGTHALLQEDVVFRDLGLAVTDEQHRFGVEQRLALAGKGNATASLTMSATPIPRTLMLAAYGDLDVSRLTEKPPGRAKIDTRAIPLDRLEEVVAGVRRAVESGAKAFWICPMIEESELIDLAAATERHKALQEVFGAKVGLLHGAMKGPAKDAVMEDFLDGRIAVLVATTVIEVGVDVPDATIMVIEHAERFGLAQLHQLRGRVGRGDRPGTCLLLYHPPLGETARARIATLRETDDGFLIAEEDLRLRGAGDVLGTRQSGLPDFRLVDMAAHRDLLGPAQDQARLLLARDSELSSPAGQAARILLYLFERDTGIRRKQAG
jgi:ATP-dependent DNA helicase RecG